MTDESTSRISKCIEILERVYGVPLRREIDPVDLLVSTILSQNTTDRNSHKAFSALKRKYPDYESLLLAPVVEIAGCIRVGGLAEIKAERIKEVLERIKGRAGAVTLEFLLNLDPEEARRYLLSLPGVGPKTASVVLLFGFGMDTMPVDTHVNRVSRRLGLVPATVSTASAQRMLDEMTPPLKYLSFHLNLIRHGRRRCRAKSPLCDGCELAGICDYVMGHKD